MRQGHTGHICQKRPELATCWLRELVKGLWSSRAECGARAQHLLPGGTHPVKALGLEEVAVGAVQLPPSSGSTAVDGFWKE